MVFKDKLGNVYIECEFGIYFKHVDGGTWVSLPDMEFAPDVSAKLYRILRLATFNGDIIDLKEAQLQ